MLGFKISPCGVRLKRLWTLSITCICCDAGEGRASCIHTGFCVALETQHDLRSSVPPSSNVFGHVPCVLLGVHRKASCQTEIANLELAIGVYEKITRLEVAVEDVGRVDVLQTAENLVDERLEMCVGEGLAGSNNGCQVTLHQLCAIVSIGRCAPCWTSLYPRRDSIH